MASEAVALSLLNFRFLLEKSVAVLGFQI